ncbi:hypothetical protein BVC80_8985g34 [Macleaya cordata]|uniref:Large ribosomal subunit protein bL25 beta domain-containing protein n=1 Tax=Macleaya cordata TaxID=56857 RepID=A0A200QJ94_MACCD|nr:hypothetical protein BVC80_8985g34 [Macleaya cordata]
MGGRWWCAVGGGLRRVMVVVAGNTSRSSSIASYHTIHAIPVEHNGTGRVTAKDIIAEGRIPTVVFSRDPENSSLPVSNRQLLTTERNQIQSLLETQVHRDHKSGEIKKLVFVRADEVSGFKVHVPLVFKGEDLSPGLKKGGYLKTMKRRLIYQGQAELIPQKIEVDVSNLDIGDKVFIRDLEVNPSLKLLIKNENFPICMITAAKLEDADRAVV